MKEQETEYKITPQQKTYFNILFLWILIVCCDYRTAGKTTMIDTLLFLYYVIPGIVLLFQLFLNNIIIWFGLLAASIVYFVFNLSALTSEIKNNLLNTVILVGICSLLVAISVLLFKVEPKRE